MVDSDSEFSELASRMRETGRTSCTIVFCETDVFIESERGEGLAAELAASGRSA